MDAEQLAELARWRLDDFAQDRSYQASYHSLSRLVVVGGCGRSGTTLLRRMLGASRRLVDGPESYLLLPVPLRTDSLEERYSLQPGRLRGLDVTNRWSFVEAFQRLVTGGKENVYWLDKTSRNVHCFKHVAERFPEAAFVHLVRDPRDVVLSLRTHPMLSRTWGRPRPTGWSQPWEACIDRWTLAVSDATSAANSIELITVRYEDLVAEPRTALKSLCESLQIEFEESMVAPGDRKSHPNERRYMPNNKRALGTLTAGRVGRWRSELPIDIRRVIEERLASYMARYAYEVGPQ
jgi:hypothetical protein